MQPSKDKLETGLPSGAEAKSMLTFSTKAGTLAQLQGQLSTAKIVPLVLFTAAQRQNEREKCLCQITSGLDDGEWIVRSSCKYEDQPNESQAGAFLSLKNISSDGLADAVDQVVASYPSPRFATRCVLALLSPTIRTPAVLIVLSTGRTVLIPLP